MKAGVGPHVWPKAQSLYTEVGQNVCCERTDGRAVEGRAGADLGQNLGQNPGQNPAELLKSHMGGAGRRVSANLHFLF